MKYLITALILTFFVNAEAQKSKIEIASRILYNSPNEKETFLKIANNKATPIKILFTQATPDMGDIETSFMSTIRQTAASLQLPLLNKGERGKADLEAVLKTIHDEYFLRYDPFANMSVTAYNKIFSNVTASVIYSMILSEKNVSNRIFISGKNNNVLLSFAWGDNLCIFDPSFMSAKPLQVVSENEKQDYFNRLVRAKILLETELNVNQDSLYLVSNYTATFLNYNQLAALIYYNQLSKNMDNINGLETLYALLKIDLVDDKFLKAGVIDDYLSEEIQSDKYKVEEELSLLYFYAMYSVTTDRFNRLVEYLFFKRLLINDTSKVYLDFADDVLKLNLSESSSVAVRRFMYFRLLSDRHSEIISDQKAPEVLNTLNELMVKDSIINNENRFNLHYKDYEREYLERLMYPKSIGEKILIYNSLYDKLVNKDIMLEVAPFVLKNLAEEMSRRLSRGNVSQALIMYNTITELKGNPVGKIYCSNLGYTLEALYNAARDKGMVNVARDIRKTINSMKQPKEVIIM